MKKIILVLSIVAALMSCSKDGEMGPAGKDGAAGTNGTNGNANVVSTTISVTTGSWAALGLGFYTDLSVLAITAANVNTVTVLVYEETIPNNWQSLPSVNGIVNSSIFFEASMVSVLVTNTDGTQANNPGNRKYRVVVIPSNARVGNIDLNNYNEVKGFYNLD